MCVVLADAPDLVAAVAAGSVTSRTGGGAAITTPVVLRSTTLEPAVMSVIGTAVDARPVLGSIVPPSPDTIAIEVTSPPGQTLDISARRGRTTGRGIIVSGWIRN
jgi:hypothetical protein